MIRCRVVRSFAIVISATLALACVDSPTAPSSPSASTASTLSAQAGSKDLSLGGVLGGILNSLAKVVKGVIDPDGIPVTPVRWASGHANETRSVSGTIGRWGGTLVIPGSDFTITFPYGALSAPTNITIISDASGYVSYDMRPHGLRFAKPVIVTQRLRHTEPYGTPLAGQLFGAYFPEDPPGLLGGVLNGVLNALEIVTSITIFGPDGRAEVQTWLLDHFSRYMLASG